MTQLRMPFESHRFSSGHLLDSSLQTQNHTLIIMIKIMVSNIISVRKAIKSYWGCQHWLSRSINNISSTKEVIIPKPKILSNLGSELVCLLDQLTRCRKINLPVTITALSLKSAITTQLCKNRAKSSNLYIQRSYRLICSALFVPAKRTLSMSFI